MKRIIAIVLAAALGLSLCACSAPEEDVLKTKEVHITAGEITPGMTAKDVSVEVTMDGEPISCRVNLTGMSSEGYWEMADNEPVADPVFLRLNVYYSLPKGYDVDNIQVTMECDGGEYDGTGSISYDDDGNVEAWSHALYGGEPEPSQTQPQEETAATDPTQTHTHSWTEVPGSYFVMCTSESTKTYNCSCGETKTESVPAPGHDLKAWSESNATCTQDGRKTTSCKRCGAGFIVEVPATGHTWSDWVKKTGRVHSRTCSVCHAEEEANHNIPSGTVTCTDCGADIIN